MALSNVLLLSQIAGHVVVLILSLCIVVPMLCHVSDFNDHCLLFTTGDWNEDTGLFDIQWSSQFYCNFTVITGFFLMFVSSIEIYRMTRLQLKKIDSSFLGLFLDTVLGFLSCLMTFGSAIIISLGFITWCSRMTLRFPSCESAAGLNITKEQDHIHTSGFHFEMGIAQFGAWSSFAASVGLTVFALLKLVSDHQLRNMKASMYLERQRLVNEDSFRDEGISDVPNAQNLPQDSP
ncbi:transmembrane protein 179 [Sitodiplosis mosellana]|uniref:transmembrane protein 179 n=1 Tax=Sitodiplosis mosellana TaxID=263140 RepID=UPI0024451688|nr:transmembrane protein 179 [Sitodiplosis mosellana]